MAASRLLASRNLHPEVPVPVLDIAEEHGLWIMFAPLGRLYGFYYRESTSAGIMLNSEHPPALQRYTAAHELGHHILNHDVSIDHEAEVTGSVRRVQEVEAFSFASNLLMPIHFVEHHLRRITGSGKNVEPTGRQVYQLSLALGVSYRALLAQMRVLGLLGELAWSALSKLQPASIKREIVGGEPSNIRANFWALSETDDGRSVFAEKDDELHIRLEEQPSSGYRWDILGGDEETVEVVASSLESYGGAEGGQLRLQVAAPRYGEKGVRHIILRARGHGSTYLTFGYRRPWLREEADAIRHFKIRVEVAESLVGESGRGLYKPQQARLLNSLAA